MTNIRLQSDCREDWRRSAPVVRRPASSVLCAPVNAVARGFATRLGLMILSMSIAATLLAVLRSILEIFVSQTFHFAGFKTEASRAAPGARVLFV